MNNLSYFLDTCPNYIKNNFASNEETILDECLGFFAWWIIGQNELYEEKNLINN